MAQSSDEIILTGNAAQLLAEYQKVNAALKAQEAATKEGAATAKAANAEEARAIATAKRALEEQKTARERINAEITRYDALVKKGVLTQAEADAAIRKTTASLQQQDTAAGGAGQKILGFGKEAITTFTGIGSALAGVMAVVNGLKAEYEYLRQRQREAKESQLTFGEHIREMASNFRPDETMSVQDLEPAVKRLMKNTGATDTVAAGALSAAFAGHGNLTNAQAVDIAEQALRILPNNAEASNQIALRAGQLMNSAGLNDPRQALGLITQIKNVATVDKLRDVGQSAVPAVMSAIRYGDTPEVGAELYTTINNLMGDVEGARTSTAFVALAEQLREFAPTSKEISKSKLPRESIARLQAAKSTSERLRILQSDPKLGEFFLENASFEKQAITAIRELVTNSPEAQAQQALAQQEIRAPNAADFEEFVSGLNRPASQDLLAKSNQARNDVKFRELALQSEGGAGLAQDMFQKALAKVDWSGPDALTHFSANRQATADMLGGADHASAYARVLEMAYMGAGGQSTVSEEDTAYLKETVALLRQIASSNSTMARQPQGQTAPPEAALGRR